MSKVIIALITLIFCFIFLLLISIIFLTLALLLFTKKGSKGTKFRPETRGLKKVSINSDV